MDMKINHAQKALRTRTETEIIDRALDPAITEHESNRLTVAATKRLLKSGIRIKDVYGSLSKRAPEG